MQRQALATDGEGDLGRRRRVGRGDFADVDSRDSDRSVRAEGRRVAERRRCGVALAAPRQLLRVREVREDQDHDRGQDTGLEEAQAERRAIDALVEVLDSGLGAARAGRSLRPLLELEGNLALGHDALVAGRMADLLLSDGIDLVAGLALTWALAGRGGVRVWVDVEEVPRVGAAAVRGGGGRAALVVGTVGRAVRVTAGPVSERVALAGRRLPRCGRAASRSCRPTARGRRT